MAAYITLNTDMKQAKGGNVRLMLWTNAFGMSNKVFAIEVLPRSADPSCARYRFSHVCSVSELVELPDYDNGETPYFRTDAVDFILEHASQVTPILQHMRADIRKLSMDFNVLNKDSLDGALQTCPNSLMRGLWTDAVQYLPNTFVIYNNSMWRCIKESKGDIPMAGSQYWERVLTSGGASEGGTTLVRYQITDTNGVLILPRTASFIILRNQVEIGYHVELIYLGEIYTISVSSDDHLVFSHSETAHIKSLRVNADSTVVEYGVFDGYVVKAVKVMPELDSSCIAAVVIYVGPDTEQYKRGHYYMGDETNGSYTWVDITPPAETQAEVILPDNVLTAPEVPGLPSQVLSVDENGNTIWVNVAEIAHGGTYWQESI